MYKKTLIPTISSAFSCFSMAASSGEGLLRTGEYYANYHGHQLDHLELVLNGLKENGHTSVVYLAGDSSLDNKHWLFDPWFSKEDKKQYSNPLVASFAVNGYENILRNPRMVKDICFWMNYYQHQLHLSNPELRSCTINTSIEESTLGDREDNLLPQDEFILNNITEKTI